MVNVQELFTLIKGKILKKDTELIEKAFNFAEKAHQDQKRMSGEPYFVHPFETAKILAKLGMDTETISAGLLHDVLEDTEIKEEEIEKEFGKNIIFLIKGVTKLGKLKYRGHERYVESLRKFFIAMASDLRVVIIKFADRLHNLRTLQYVREDKRRRIALEALEVYAPLADRLGMGKLKGKIEDAAFPYVYPKEFGELEEIIQGKIQFSQENLEKIGKELKKELSKNKVKFEISYRMKHKYSIWKKLLEHEKDLGKIYDIVALRVIADSIEDCYKTLGIVHSIWKPLPGRIKDYIALPKLNGYQSLHTTVLTDQNGVAEIQIRTKEMDLEADFGIAAHFTYKENNSKKNKNNQTSLKWLEELKNLNYTPGDSKNFIEHLKTDFFNDRIFIFTPGGDVLDLPKDSSPIDFAYNIHSDLGEHISGSKINGKMSHIFSPLKNGDIVEIINKKDAHPSSKWLDYTKTTMAKRHIRAYLEKHSLLNRLKSFGQS